MYNRKPGDYPSKDASRLVKALDPRNSPVEMSLRDAEVELSNLVYEATALIERLEGAGLVWGNGHHHRQRVAEFATNLLKESWRGPKE
jgi:hypothetical protein